MTLQTDSGSKKNKKKKKKSSGWFSWFSSDPYVHGCVEVRENDGTWHCTFRTKKFYFNEGEDPGSMDKAWRDCGNAVDRIGRKKFKNYDQKTREGYYTSWCEESG